MFCFCLEFNKFEHNSENSKKWINRSSFGRPKSATFPQYSGYITGISGWVQIEYNNELKKHTPLNVSMQSILKYKWRKTSNVPCLPIISHIFELIFD